MTNSEAHTPTSHHPEIVSTRVIDAPREAVFRAFSDPAVLARWWGPKGFRNRFDEFDPRPGGMWRFEMTGAEGQVYTMAKQFLDYVPRERIVLRHDQLTHAFRMEMSFADEGQKTRLTWRFDFDSPDEARRVQEAISEANEQNFDRLEAELAKSPHPTSRP